MLEPIPEVMESGERWLQQRQEFRRNALRRLRQREGIVEGGHDVVNRRGEAVELPWQTGAQKGPDSADAFEQAARDTNFNLSVADAADLARELSDLDRDAQNLEKSERVAFLDVPQGSTMDDVIIESHVRSHHFGVVPDSESDEKLLEWMQNELLRRRSL